MNRAVCGRPGGHLAIVLSGVSRAGVSETQHPVPGAFFRNRLEAVVGRVGDGAHGEDVEVAVANPGHLSRRRIEG